VKALTLWPEWLPTITHLDKRIENRDWFPPKGLIGQRFALHAGSQLGGGSRHRVEWVERTALEAGWGVRILLHETASRFAFFRPATSRTVPIHLGCVVASAVLDRAERGPADPARWAMEGAVHWHLRDVEVLETPIPAKGRQGLWNWEPPADTRWLLVDGAQ